MFEPYECIMCGEFAEEGKFCSDHCSRDYYHENRTCDGCGGEFWDGGHSCLCEDDEESINSHDNCEVCGKIEGLCFC